MKSKMIAICLNGHTLRWSMVLELNGERLPHIGITAEEAQAAFKVGKAGTQHGDILPTFGTDAYDKETIYWYFKD